MTRCFWKCFPAALFSSVGRGIGLCLALLLWLSGCALNYVDDKGVKHVMGLVNMKIEPAVTSDQTIAESVQIQTVGFSLYSTSINRGVVLGYNRENLTTVYNNAMVGDLTAIFQRKE